MACRTTEFLLAEPRTQAYERVQQIAGQQGWRITKTTPPGRYFRLTPELNLKAGPAQLEGCGSTQVQFERKGTEGTCVRIFTRRALTDSRADTPAISLLTGLHLDPADHDLDPKRTPLPGRSERGAIRILVPIVIALAIAAYILVPIPRDKQGDPDPPSIALNRPELFHVEAALLVFYSGLLLLTPAVAAMFRGRLPNEISARGAKFDEETIQSRAEVADTALADQKKTLTRLGLEMTAAKTEIQALAERLGLQPGKLEKLLTGKSADD